MKNSPLIWGFRFLPGFWILIQHRTKTKLWAKASSNKEGYPRARLASTATAPGLPSRTGASPAMHAPATPAMRSRPRRKAA
jgi:hypothetical protein